MEHRQTIKELIKESFSFCKDHSKDLVFLFLPVALGVLVLSLVFGLYDGRLPVYAGVIFGLMLFMIKALRGLLVYSGGMMCEDLKQTKSIDPFDWYKRLFGKLPQVLWVLLLELLLSLGFFIVSVVGGLIVFMIPFFTVVFSVRVFPSFLNQISLYGNNMFIGMFVFSIILIVGLNIWFALGLWSTPYTLLLDNKKGLDAITSSILHASKKRWQMIYRIFITGVLAITPSVIILAPLYFVIVQRIVKQIALSYLTFGKFIIPKLPIDLLLWKSGLGFVSVILVLPMLVVYNYFIWKYVKSHSHNFSESTYKKTYKLVKVGVWFGAVLMTIYVSFAVSFIVSNRSSIAHDSKLDFDNISPSGMIR